MNKCPKCGSELTACVPCYLSPIELGTDGEVIHWDHNKTDIQTEPWEFDDEQFYLFCDHGHYFRWRDGWEWDLERTAAAGGDTTL